MINAGDAWELKELQQKYERILELQPANRDKDKLKLRECLSHFLSTSTVERLPEYIITVLDEIEDWKPTELVRAFDALETYAINLLDFPWKKEFRVILVSFGTCLAMTMCYIDLQLPAVMKKYTTVLYCTLSYIAAVEFTLHLYLC